jgi:hypothetical protein
MVLVDSCVWIEAARKQGDLKCKVALQSLLEEFEAAVCAPVKLEVLGGCRQEKRAKMAAGFEVLPYFPMTEKTWEEAIRVGWRLRDRGVVVPWNDILIATICLEHDCRVYSVDKHFALMSEVLGIPLYEPGYGGMYNPGAGG